MDDTPLQTALDRLADADILLVQGLPPEATIASSTRSFRMRLMRICSRAGARHCTVASAEFTRPVRRYRCGRTGVARASFHASGLTEPAIEWWGTAGQRSLERSALIEGAEQLKRALDQIATLPATPALRREQIKLEVAFANALALTGDLVSGKEHYDRALAIYDPAEDRPLTTRSGRDLGVTLLSFRSNCVWQLGYPVASRNDAERAVKNAREMGHATTLMYALTRAAIALPSAEITPLHMRMSTSLSLWQTKRGTYGKHWNRIAG